MKAIQRLTMFTIGGMLAVTSATAQAGGPGVGPDAALKSLMDGNQRFVGGQMTHPHDSAARRAELASTQHPFAVIIGCSDSRVAPELVFDEGIGDLFVVRTAGNRLDDLVLASVEYAVEHLGCSLVVVMGHERCGAITAAIDAAKEPASAHEHDAAGSHVPVLLHILQDAVTTAKGEPGDAVENTVVENVRIVTTDLPMQSPLLAAGIKAGTLKVVGMRYDLDTGAVSPVEPHAPVAASQKKK